MYRVGKRTFVPRCPRNFVSVRKLIEHNRCFVRTFSTRPEERKIQTLDIQDVQLDDLVSKEQRNTIRNRCEVVADCVLNASMAFMLFGTGFFSGVYALVISIREEEIRQEDEHNHRHYGKATEKYFEELRKADESNNVHDGKATEKYFEELRKEVNSNEKSRE